MMAKKSRQYAVADWEMMPVLEVAEAGGFAVTAPLIPGLVTEAEASEEAFEMARYARHQRVRLRHLGTNEPPEARGIFRRNRGEITIDLMS